MLKRLVISGFKSIRQVELDLAHFTVLFGPNSAGKSNILDAIQTLSRLATERTIEDALAGPIRGHPVEVFSFPSGGMRSLIESDHASFHISAIIERFEKTKQPYKYEVGIEISPRTGKLSVCSEHLETLNRKTGLPKGRPRIRTEADTLHMPSGQGRPKSEPLHQNHTKLSDERYSGQQYYAIEQCRRELGGWEIYYFDPREAMRRSSPPSQVSNIGRLGEHLSAFLYRLKNEESTRFKTLQRTLTTVIPSISDLDVILDNRQGTLDIMITQGGVEYSARVMSEGTLRVLALCAIAINPWGGSLVAIEEPENGVQPQRIELIAQLLMSMSSDRKQIIVTSHSPIFCSSAISAAREMKKPIDLYGVLSKEGSTFVKRVKLDGPLFEPKNIGEFLESKDDAAILNALMTRGLLYAL